MTFIDQANQEYSRDIEPMKADILTIIICSSSTMGVLKAQIPFCKQDRIRQSIYVVHSNNGMMWACLLQYALGTLKRNHTGYGGIVYNNEAGLNE